MNDPEAIERIALALESIARSLELADWRLIE